MDPAVSLDDYWLIAQQPGALFPYLALDCVSPATEPRIVK
jgi:hypothetical protein